jgi:hypothetical protein
MARRFLVIHSARRSVAALLCALAVAAVAAIGPHAPVAAQAPDPKDQCKNGGFANFIDPSTGQPFRNQGQCVSHANQGGVLVPVTPPAPLSDLVITISCREYLPSSSRISVACYPVVYNIGPGPVSIPVGAVQNVIPETNEGNNTVTTTFRP